MIEKKIDFNLTWNLSSAVLTFIGYKQTDKQTSQIYI